MTDTLNLEKSGEYDTNVDPLTNFLFALNAPETRRQYPKELEVFLDFLNLTGTFENRVSTFYHKSMDNPSWLSKKLIEFIQYKKQRVQKNEISESTIPNYFMDKIIFCVMHL